MREPTRLKQPLVILLGGALGLLPLSPGGHHAADHARPAVDPMLSLPAGARLDYGLSLGPIHAGTATLSVSDAGPAQGTPSYKVTLRVTGGGLFLSVDDSLVSWIATRPLHTIRSDRLLKEGPYKDALRIELGDADGQYRVVPLPGAPAELAPPTDSSGVMPEKPLDELGLLYLPRTMRLEPGRRFSIPRYFEAKNNPIDIRVLDRKRIHTPAGWFDVLPLDVRIPDNGLFAPKHHARVFVTDDSARTVVELTSDTQLGKLRLYLTGRGH